MEEGQVPPPQATVLAFGNYEQQNGEHVVELPTMAKLYSQSNALSMIALGFERAVLGDKFKPEFTWEIIEDISKVPRGRWYVDIETKGDAGAQKPSWEHIISLSITVAHHQVGHTYVLPEEYVVENKSEIQTALRNVPDSIIMHNGQFDAKYIGVPFDEDTMLKHYAIFPVAPHGLKELGKYYLGMNDWDAPAKKYLGKLKAANKKKLEEQGKIKIASVHGESYMEAGVEYTASNGYERIPRNILYEYNAIDTYVTWLLDELMNSRWLMQDGYDYARTTYEMLLEYSHMFLDIEQQGIRFDVPYMENLERELAEKQSRLERELNEIVGYEVNPRSPKQVKEALRARGVRVRSTDEKTMQGIDDPMAEKILEIRHVSKQLGTYVSGYRKQILGDRGYPGFKLHASTTGRIGGSGPSLLTLPRDKSMQRMVLPSKEGHVLLATDLSQAELRFLAAETQDEHLLDAFNSGEDFFDNLLGNIYEGFDKNEVEDYSTLRATIKGVVYGKSFARGDKAISEALNISMEEAKRFSDAFIVPKGNFEQWRKDIGRKATHAEPLVNRYGRQYHNEVVMFYTSQNIMRTGLSFLSQSTCNDLVLQVAFKLWDSNILKRKYDAQIISTIHDNIVISCPEEHKEEIAKIVQDLYRREGISLMGDSVIFESESEWGYNLGEMEVLEL